MEVRPGAFTSGDGGFRIMDEKDDASIPSLPEFARNRIGSKLRSIFNSLEQEPIPDRFKDLLQQLDASAGKQELAEEQARITAEDERVNEEAGR